MKTLLVTGAAGTVGNYVVSLAEAAGYKVVASDRTAAGVRVPVRGEVRAGDLCDPVFVERVVRGCDFVIHTAAQLDVTANPAELAQVNSEAVATLYEACEAASVRRFIHTSTAMLYAVGDGTPLTEQSRIAPRGAYGLSKHGAEVFLRGRAGSAKTAWTIVRAAPIYGRRGRHFAASLLSVGPILRLGSPILPRCSGGPVSTFVHAEDVASALLFVLEKDVTANQVFNVSDDGPISLGDRLAETFHSYGLRTFPFSRLPSSLLRATARLFDAPGTSEGLDAAALSAWRLVVLRHRLKPALRPRFDREALTLLYDDLVVDISKLRSLGWAPRFPRFSDGFRQVLRWYQAENWVPRYA